MIYIISKCSISYPGEECHIFSAEILKKIQVKTPKKTIKAIIKRQKDYNRVADAAINKFFFYSGRRCVIIYLL